LYTTFWLKLPKKKRLRTARAPTQEAKEVDSNNKAAQKEQMQK
jgi:hypothetical protein